jgi:hypothetical protein
LAGEAHAHGLAEAAFCGRIWILLLDEDLLDDDGTPRPGNALEMAVHGTAGEVSAAM